MTILFKAVAIVLVLIAALLIYAVINALTSDEGARAGVAVLYIIGAAIGLYVAKVLWTRPASGRATV